MMMTPEEQGFWHCILLPAGGMRDVDDARFANIRICKLCEGQLLLSAPDYVRDFSYKRLGHDPDCPSLSWAAQITFTGGGGGGVTPDPLFGNTAPIFGSTDPVFGAA